LFCQKTKIWSCMANRVSNYLVQGNLSFKPIGGRIGSFAVSLYNDGTEGVNRELKFGKVILALSKATLAAAGALVILVSAVEFVAAGTLGVLGYMFCSVRFLRSEFMEKHTLKAFSYSLSSAAYAIAPLVLALSRRFPNTFTTQAIANHACHVAPALFVQATVGYRFDVRRGLEEEAAQRTALRRAAYVIADDLPYAAGEILTGFLRDVEPARLIDQMDDLIRRNGGIAQLRQLLEVFRALRDPGRAAGAELVIDLGLGRGLGVTEYQTHLQGLMKQTYLEIVRSDTLSAAFKDPDLAEGGNAAASGRESLEGFEAHTFPMLANMAQLKELEEADIHCPAHFGDGRGIRDLNGRRADIERARGALAGLSAAQRQALKTKLLGTGAPGAAPDEAVNAAFRQVSTLAGSLYQGALITRTGIDLAAARAGRDPTVAQNIFQRAMQDAQGEFEAEGGAPAAAPEDRADAVSEVDTEATADGRDLDRDA
jgi:hypothetical protein